MLDALECTEIIPDDSRLTENETERFSLTQVYDEAKLDTSTVWDFPGFEQLESEKQTSNIDGPIKQPVFFPRKKELDYTLDTSITLEKAHGTVKKVNKKNFVAELECEDGQVFEATFKTSSVGQGDRRLIKEGALFYWFVSELNKITGYVSHEQTIIFKRFPLWKNLQLSEPNEYADNFFNDCK